MKYISFLILLHTLFAFKDNFSKLSEYNIFDGDQHNLKTTEKFTPYDLITPLFSDYSWKHRSIYVPNGEYVEYHNTETFKFPIGTIISKTFYYPKDFNDLEKGISLKETRILIHKESGWIALPYIWNEDETEAYLEITGGIKKAKWIDYNGKTQNIDYIIPNMNQCKGCHVNNNKEMFPIGPKARNINSDYNYGDEIENQIVKWKRLGYLTNHPPIENIDKVAKWNDVESGLVSKRARSWLDINCAHCHNLNGPANNTGLLLDYYQTDKKSLGFFKTPVAAGRGSGSLKYDIYPGYPEKSIMVYRFNSTEPGIMMPELGRTMIHHEGLELIKEWILSLK